MKSVSTSAYSNMIICFTFNVNMRAKRAPGKVWRASVSRANRLVIYEGQNQKLRSTHRRLQNGFYKLTSRKMRSSQKLDPFMVKDPLPMVT